MREIELTADLVQQLLRDQHPDLADLPVTFGARGWDNQLWRLGDDLAVRLPWQTQSADALVRKEYEWLPGLVPLLPLPVPVPQRLGEPSPRYPHPWIVTTWVPGTAADTAPPSNGGSASRALAEFLVALNQPAPAGAPRGRDRGGPLRRAARGVAHRLESLSDACATATDLEMGPSPDVENVQAVWEDALAAPGWDGPPLWLHGDLHPANVLTANGDLAGVIDFGDLCAGDPALDLSASWIILPDFQDIERFRSASPLAQSDATWRRARGWAVWRALGSLSIATADHAGRKPTWGPPALRSLLHLTSSAM